MEREKLRKLAGILLLAAAVAGGYAFLRGPQVSAYLKRRLFTQFAFATGYQIKAGRLYANMFPFYVGARDLKMLDGAGGTVLSVKGVKAYVDLPALLEKKVIISRLVLFRPDIMADSGRVEHFLRLRAAKGRGGFSIRLNRVVIRDGALSFARHGGTLLSCRGLDAVAALDGQEASLSCAEIRISLRSGPVSARLNRAKMSFRGGVFRLSGLSLEAGASRVDLSGVYSGRDGGRARLDASLSAATLVNYFRLKGPAGGSLQVAGEAVLPAATPRRLKDIRVDMEVKGGMYAQTFLELLHADADVNGFAGVDARVKGTLKGPAPLEDMAISGKGSLQDALIYGAASRRLDFKVGLKNGFLVFNGIRGRLYGGRAAGMFSINIGKGGEAANRKLGMDVSFSNMDSRRFLTGFLKLRLPLPEGRLSGRLTNRAARFIPSGSFRFRATRRGKDFTGRIRTVQGGFALDTTARTVNFSRLQVWTALTAIDGKGAIDYGRAAIDMAFSMSTKDLTDLTLPYSTLATGAGRFDGSVSGPVDDPTFKGSVSMAGACIKGVRAGAVSGVISYNKRLLQMQGARAVSGAQTIEAEGRILFPGAKEIFDLGNPDYDIDLKLRRFPAAGAATVIKPGLKGISGLITAADLKVRGPVPKGPVLKGPVRVEPDPPDPDVSGNVRAQDVAWRGFKAPTVSFTFDYAGGRISVSRGVLMEKKGSAVSFSGSAAGTGPSGDGRFDFSARSSGVDLEELFPRKNLPLDYTLSFTAQGGGTIKKPRVKVEGRLERGRYIPSGNRYKGRPLPGGKFMVSVLPSQKTEMGGRTALFQLSLLAGEAVLKGQALLEGDLPWQAGLTLKNGPYTYLVSPFLKNVPPHFFVALQGGGQFSGTFSKKGTSIDGRLDLNRLFFAVSGQHFSAQGPVSIAVRNETLTLRPMALTGTGTALNLSGTVAIGKDFDVYARGKSSLELLKGFLPLKASLLSGDASYDVRVSGPWGRPGLSGGVTLSDAAVGIEGAPFDLMITSARLRLDPKLIVLQEFLASAGGGRIGATGALYMNGLSPARYYFEGKLTDVGLSVRGFNAVLGGNFVVQGEGGSRTIVGEMRIERAVYSKNVDLRGLILKKRAARPPSPGSFEATTGLRIRMQGARGIMIENNIARAPLSVDLTLMGTLARPIPLGRVEASSGDIYFRSSEFSISHASAVFADPDRVDPYLDMQANTTMRGYRITINMSGSANGLNMAFSSEPHLEQMQILSLLTTGNFSGSGYTDGFGGGGVDASEASSFLTGQYQKVITDRLKSITGFDRFSVAPYISQTGTVSPMVTVSKRLLGDKLFVIYSSPIGTQEQIIRVEYAVSPGVSIVGDRDDIGDLGGDMEFKFKFR